MNNVLRVGLAKQLQDQHKAIDSTTYAKLVVSQSSIVVGSTWGSRALLDTDVLKVVVVVCRSFTNLCVGELCLLMCFLCFKQVRTSV